MHQAHVLAAAVLVHAAGAGVRGGKSGAVTVVQRSSSDLRLNPHYHLVALESWS